MGRYSHVGLLYMNSALGSLPTNPVCFSDTVQAVANGADQNLNATMVAAAPANIAKSQELAEANPDTKTARITGPNSLPHEELHRL